MGVQSVQFTLIEQEGQNTKPKALYKRYVSHTKPFCKISYQNIFNILQSKKSKGIQKNVLLPVLTQSLIFYRDGVEGLTFRISQWITKTLFF